MQQRINDFMEFCRFLVQRFLADRGPQSAAALTYTTLFAVVPLMTVTFAMLSAIPAFHGVGEQIQMYIFNNFIPSTGATIQQYLVAFTMQARQLTWFGVGFLMATALMMMLTIEKAFNLIWRVRQPRRGMSSFLLYWAILSLGPLLLGAGFAMSTYIASLSLLSGPYALLGAGTLLKAMPLLLSVAAFTLIYAAVPNTRVPLRHALVGGLFTSVLFEAAKQGFGLYVSYFPSYQLIYGAFAAVPLFLLWIYLSWIIVLFGAELVCGLSSSQQWRRQPAPRLLVMLALLRIFYQHQQAGREVRLTDAHRNGWMLPEDEWDEILEFFERERLVCRTSAAGWVLSRDLHHYSFDQLLRSNPWPVSDYQTLPEHVDEPWYPALRQALEALQVKRSKLFGGSVAVWLQAEPAVKSEFGGVRSQE
ncbi:MULTISPECIES: virulence factor BrkB family protein [Pseudomonadaceae]|uniref:virulence factor BrkB family protein n=1 Tax=Pseudomonadaceae TaxID=135621 RepID=UPI00187D3BB3|nr:MULTISPECIES: virulence factor BrkB family protein [Pseudomonadaceae]MBE7926585.1 virulence factor BrkB family protein [Pseudomonas saudiphocaensis]MCF6782457.1 virulence factor BrkB family protein [Stutzerimonas stutzeri]MCF6805562.1 virulence factor BrkB family protein [Stutzerimonas stutzeri]